MTVNDAASVAKKSSAIIPDISQLKTLCNRVTPLCNSYRVGAWTFSWRLKAQDKILRRVHFSQIAVILFILPGVMTAEHENTVPLMSKIIAHTNFHAASSVNWQEIINSICPLLKEVYIFDIQASGVEPRPRRESGSTSLSSTWLHLIRRDAGEDVGVVLMLTDFPL